MENIAIIGAGGFGREVKFLIDLINSKEYKYNFLGFFDDNFKKGEYINGYPILGDVSTINNIPSPLALAIAIGEPKVKRSILSKISNSNITFPSLIAPDVILDSQTTVIERGSVICSGCKITVNITIEEFTTLNLGCTVGHDTIIKKFSSFMPYVNISGEVTIDEGVYCGTGSQIINRLSVGTNTIIGAGAVVSKSLPPNCTAVGIPAKPIKFH